MITMISHQTLV